MDAWLIADGRKLRALRMNLHPDDTIAALASAPGPALRGIVRLSGPDVREILDGVFDPDDPARWRAASRRSPRGHALTARRGVAEAPQPQPRPSQTQGVPHGHSQRYTGRLRFSAARIPLPTAVYLWPHRRSYTGQPVAELHTVGSPPLLDAVLGQLYDCGARPAQPGEFTLRAFLAGRLDLMQAEAVLGVIDAHNHRELESALSQLAGGISGPLAEVRADLLNLLADLEAGLDFVEEDIEFVQREEIRDRLTAAQSTLQHLLQQADSRIQTTGRVRVALAGLPNAGKSTLFNALAGHQAALVSEVRGTTRDYLTADLDLGGIAVELIDTAGWEDEVAEVARIQTASRSLGILENSATSSGNGITTQAQTTSRRQREQADLIVWCTAVDADASILEADAESLAALREQDRPVLAVQTKSDLVPGRSRLSAKPQAADSLSLSAVTGAGLSELIEAVSSLLSQSHSGGKQWLGMTAARCRESLATAAAALQSAQQAAEAGTGDEILAIEVRDALDPLGHILGTIYTDDLLDRIFSKFCIGK